MMKNGEDAYGKEENIMTVSLKERWKVFSSFRVGAEMEATHLKKLAASPPHAGGMQTLKKEEIKISSMRR